MDTIFYQYVVMMHALPFSFFHVLMLSGGNTSGWARHRSEGINWLPNPIAKDYYELWKRRIAYHALLASVVVIFKWRFFCPLAHTAIFDRNSLICFSSNTMHHLYFVVGVSQWLRVWKPHWRRHGRPLSLCQGWCACVFASTLMWSDWMRWIPVHLIELLHFFRFYYFANYWTPWGCLHFQCSSQINSSTFPCRCPSCVQMPWTFKTTYIHELQHKLPLPTTTSAPTAEIVTTCTRAAAATEQINNVAVDPVDDLPANALIDPRTGLVDDLKVVEKLAKDYGICVLPGSACGAPGYIRVGYANLPPDQVLYEGAISKSWMLKRFLYYDF